MSDESPKPAVIAPTTAKASSANKRAEPSVADLVARFRRLLVAFHPGDDLKPLVHLLRDLAVRDSAQALALLRERDIPERAKLFAGLMTRVFDHYYFEMHPGFFKQVLETFECDPAIALDKDAVLVAFEYLAREDFAGAWKAAFEMERPFRMSATTAFIRALHKLDKRAALDFLSTQPESAPRSEIMMMSANLWSRDDLAGLLGWMKDHPDAAAQLSKQWMEAAVPRSAAELAALNHLANGFYTARQAADLVKRIDETGDVQSGDPFAGPAKDGFAPGTLKPEPWLRALPPGLLRDHGLVASFLRHWNGDRDAVQRLLPEIQSIDAKRELTSAIAADLAVKDMTTAFAFIATLDETSQMMARRTIARSIYGERVPAAMAYFNAHLESLDRYAKEMLSEYLPKQDQEPTPVEVKPDAARVPMRFSPYRGNSEPSLHIYDAINSFHPRPR